MNTISSNANSENQNELDDNKTSDKSLSQKLIEGSNKSLDDFIKWTREDSTKSDKALRWIDFETFKDIKQIGEGGFAKVYSATWLSGGKKFIFTDPTNGTEKIRTLPKVVALKSIKGSDGISTEYLNEMEIYYKLTVKNGSLLFYGITKDPKSSEFMMVTELAVNGSLRSLLAKNFTKLNWKEKIHILTYIVVELKSLHEQGICHKDFHSGNILKGIERYYITDFGLSGPSNKFSKDIYGILGYVAPEVLKGNPYNSPADIYSFGIIMTELSSGFPPYFNKDMGESALALSICNGLRPDLGKGTPEIYKSLVSNCMNANPEKRPTAIGLEKITKHWYDCLTGKVNDDDAKKIKLEFDMADKEIPNVQSLFRKNSNFKYVSKHLSFNLNNLNDNDNDVKDIINLDSDLIELKLDDLDYDDTEN